MAALAARFAVWVPVLVALGLFAHVGLLGLRPSLAETRRLSLVERALQERHRTAMEEEAHWSRLLRAQQDPIYLERERRMLRSPRTQ